MVGKNVAALQPKGICVKEAAEGGEIAIAGEEGATRDVAHKAGHCCTAFAYRTPLTRKVRRVRI